MYKPISCDFYDEVINTITLHQKVTLAYETTNDIEHTEGMITDVFTRNKEEFCLINNIEIRLDKIRSLHLV